MNHLLLYGPSGTGKSAAGKRLADALDLPFIDLDIEIEAAAGMTVEAIFSDRGEAAFRRLESETLAQTLKTMEDRVVALGGGALLNDQNRQLAEQSGHVICLRADARTLLERLQQSTVVRPLLASDPETSVRRYLSGRKAHYDSFDRQLVTDSLDIRQTAWEMQKMFGRFRLKQMGQPYDVRVGSGLRQHVGALMKQMGLGGPVCVVADRNTEQYGNQVLAALQRSGFKAALTVIPDGEAYKTVDSVQALWSSFLDNGLERGSTVVAVGGGVVGDLAGFAAATYLRGIRWVCIPTSLLAMVDASIGGKTGADLPQGKNLVGAFHAPALVVVDPEVLATLPERELRAGMAEVVKAGVIADAALFERCRTLDLDGDLSRLVPSAMSIKIGIIESDPYERGERALLNFGHTIGHAVEHGSGFELLHGEAIAIGMFAEARIAEHIGVAPRGTADAIAACLTHIGLPTGIPADLSAERLSGTIMLDKKKTGGAIKFALPAGIGSARLVSLAAEDFLAFLK